MIKYINLTLYKNERREKEHKNIKAVCNDNSYLFTLDEVKTHLNNNYFTRETEEYEFILDLINKTASYTLKEKNMSFDIEVEKINIDKQDNITTLEYKISSDDETFKLIIEENKNE